MNDNPYHAPAKNSDRLRKPKLHHVFALSFLVVFLAMLLLHFRPVIRSDAIISVPLINVYQEIFRPSMLGFKPLILGAMFEHVLFSSIGVCVLTALVWLVTVVRRSKTNE